MASAKACSVDGAIRHGLTCLILLCSCLLATGCAPITSSAPSSVEASADALAEMEWSPEKALEDGRVSESEYRSAIEAQRRCVISIGGSPEEIKDVGGGELGFGYSYDAKTEGDLEAFQRNADECASANVEAVSRMWVKQNRPSAQESASIRSGLLACLKREGLSLSEGISDDDLIRSMSDAATNASNGGAVVQCAREHSRYFESGDL